jgi:hypothetical protein
LLDQGGAEILVVFHSKHIAVTIRACQCQVHNLGTAAEACSAAPSSSKLYTRHNPRKPCGPDGVKRRNVSYKGTYPFRQISVWNPEIPAHLADSSVNVTLAI